MNNKFLIFFSVAFLLLGFSLVSAYSGTITITKTGGGKIIIGDVAPVPTHYCGNEILETYIGEQCDGVVYTGCSGIDANWVGELSCAVDCLYDTSGCSVAPVGYCGDATCNNGETCSTCTTDCGSCGGGGSGGSSGGSPDDDDEEETNPTESSCIEDWSCNEWTSCIDGFEMRTCSDSNECGTDKIKPLDERGCSMINVNGTSVESNGGFLTAITGAVIGGATAGWGLAIIFLVAVIGGFIYVRMRRNKKKVKNVKKSKK